MMDAQPTPAAATPAAVVPDTLVLVDAAYIDRVVFEMTVYMERVLERRIPKADLAEWLTCVALDGGLRPGDNHVEVYFVHDGAHATLANFQPDDM